MKWWQKTKKLTLEKSLFLRWKNRVFNKEQKIIKRKRKKYQKWAFKTVTNFCPEFCLMIFCFPVFNSKFPPNPHPLIHRNPKLPPNQTPDGKFFCWERLVQFSAVALNLISPSSSSPNLRKVNGTRRLTDYVSSPKPKNFLSFYFRKVEGDFLN